MITERKLRQIIKQELSIILESRQPTEDLAELYLKLDSLLSFPLGGKHKEQTLSFLENEMILTINDMIRMIESDDLSKNINEIFKFLNYFKRQPEPKSNLFEKTDLQLSVEKVKNKLKELEKVIFHKRAGKNKEYQTLHQGKILPIIKYLSDSLSDLINKNTQFPNPNPRRTKRDLLKRVRWGY
jgi:hypothetical protein